MHCLGPRENMELSWSLENKISLYWFYLPWPRKRQEHDNTWPSQDNLRDKREARGVVLSLGLQDDLHRSHCNLGCSHPEIILLITTIREGKMCPPCQEQSRILLELVLPPTRKMSPQSFWEPISLEIKSWQKPVPRNVAWRQNSFRGGLG